MRQLVECEKLKVGDKIRLISFSNRFDQARCIPRLWGDRFLKGDTYIVERIKDGGNALVRNITHKDHTKQISAWFGTWEYVEVHIKTHPFVQWLKEMDERRAQCAKVGKKKLR